MTWKLISTQVGLDLDAPPGSPRLLLHSMLASVRRLPEGRALRAVAGVPASVRRLPEGQALRAVAEGVRNCSQFPGDLLYVLGQQECQLVAQSYRCTPLPKGCKDHRVLQRVAPAEGKTAGKHPANTRRRRWNLRKS